MYRLVKFMGVARGEKVPPPLLYERHRYARRHRSRKMDAKTAIRRGRDCSHPDLFLSIARETIARNGAHLFARDIVIVATFIGETGVAGEINEKAADGNTYDFSFLDVSSFTMSLVRHEDVITARESDGVECRVHFPAQAPPCCMKSFS